jgi:hypothetical protein
MSFDVFISYPHQDKTIADAACAALEAQDIRCWIAPRDIAPGADWAGSIVEAIDNCRAMVLIFSAHSNGSKQVYREVQQAFDGDKPVVPFRIENVTPAPTLRYYMNSVHWLDALTPPIEQHLKVLIASVRALISARSPALSSVDREIEHPIVDPLPQPPIVHDAPSEDAKRENNIGGVKRRRVLMLSAAAVLGVSVFCLILYSRSNTPSAQYPTSIANVPGAGSTPLPDYSFLAVSGCSTYRTKIGRTEKTLALLVADSPNGISAARLAQQNARQNGFSIVAEVRYPPLVLDFASFFLNVKQNRPDVLAVCGPYNNNLLKQAGEFGLI